ncbi:MAG: branched-chain amino acid ABC transporter permease [Acidiferrobacterales bacterium]|nr:branched-chain amino acid ABC transporter permease [Acidiferrobacterales bacterium]
MDSKNSQILSLGIHAAVVISFYALQYVLPEYHLLALTRIMLLAIFALGFNLLFGYTGLLSLGHAMFFAAGMYGAGLTVYHFGWSVPGAFLFGVVCGAILGFVIGMIALRTTGVAFMIVTLMFAKVSYLVIVYFTTYTRGDEGLVMPAEFRGFELLGMSISLTDSVTRYNLALLLLTLTMLIVFLLVRGRFGRALVAIRENESRTRMLGYNTFAIKLKVLTASAALSAMAGSAYALMFAYIGSSFATIQYSIDPLLYTLLGGAGTVLGPVFGTFSMFYLIDIASEYTSAYLLVTGIVLVLLILYFPKGVFGAIRQKYCRWLP